MPAMESYTEVPAGFCGVFPQCRLLGTCVASVGILALRTILLDVPAEKLGVTSSGIRTLQLLKRLHLGTVSFLGCSH